MLNVKFAANFKPTIKRKFCHAVDNGMLLTEVHHE